MGQGAHRPPNDNQPEDQRPPNDLQMGKDHIFGITYI